MRSDRPVAPITGAARRLRVKAVTPGAVTIPEAPRDPDLTQRFVAMIPLGRLATPGDVAAVCIAGPLQTVSGGYRP